MPSNTSCTSRSIAIYIDGGRSDSCFNPRTPDGLDGKALCLSWLADLGLQRAMAVPSERGLQRIDPRDPKTKPRAGDRTVMSPSDNSRFAQQQRGHNTPVSATA